MDVVTHGTEQDKSNKVLLVDDEEELLASLRRDLGGQFAISTANSGAQALQRLASEGPFAVVVSDLKMPGMDGVVLLDKFRRITPDTVRIMLTGQADRGQVIEAINNGYLFRFLEKPVSNESLSLAISAGIRQHHRVMAEKELFALQKRHRFLTGVIGSFVKLMEARDPYTAGHQERVAALVVAIAREMGFSDRNVEVIGIAGTIHDLGKLYVPAEFLNRPGTLSPIEFQVVKQHPAVGYSVLREVEFDLPVAEYVHQHHERLDGRGYPLGLKGDEIYLEAKILAVADVVEAMSSHRPYRPALGLEKAVEEIIRGKGQLYQPEVVEACLSVLDRKLWTQDKPEVSPWLWRDYAAARK
jgi:putative nucleotidyltransferase with HDIG domain